LVFEVGGRFVLLNDGLDKSMTNKQNQAAQTVRHDLYGAIHRGLRKTEMDMLSRIGTLDANDDAAVSLMVKDFRKLIALARYYLVFENDIHAQLNVRRPGAVAVGVAGHADHGKAFAGLEFVLGTLATLRGEGRRRQLRALYLRFSEFIAHDFEHMLDEEQVVQPLLQTVFTAEELADLEQRLIDVVPREIVRSFIAIIVPALDPSAQADLIARLERCMAPEVFAEVMRDSIRPVVNDADWHRLNDVAQQAA
jgi:hypothetical protein